MTVDEQMTWLLGIAESFGGRELRLESAIKDVCDEVVRLREELTKITENNAEPVSQWIAASALKKFPSITLPTYRYALERIRIINQSDNDNVPRLIAEIINEVLD